MKVLICIFSTLIISNFVHAKSNSMILSHYEFTHLTKKQKIAYIKGLREIVLEVEKIQQDIGVNYEVASNRHPWMFRLIASAVAADDANDVNKPSCVYAGWISNYPNVPPKPLTCQNKWRHDGDRKLINCNKFLFGKIHVASGDRATKRCEAKRKELKISDEDIVNSISDISIVDEYNDFKDKFDKFCVEGEGSSKKNISYHSCNVIKKRLAALESKINIKISSLQKSHRVEVTVDPPTPNIQEGVCGNGSSNTCVKCPDPIPVAKSRPVSFQDISGTKYGEFISTVADACGGDKNVLAAKYGDCSQVYVTKNKNVKKFVGKIDDNEKNTVKAWAFEDYFGFSPEEAHDLFCDKGFSNQDAIDMAEKYNTPLFSLDMAGPNLKDFIKDDSQMDGRPTWAMKSNGNGTIDNETLNKVKASKAYRHQFETCLKDPSTKKSVATTTHVTPICRLKIYDSISSAQLQSLREKWDPKFGVCVQVEGENGSRLCSFCNKENECNCNTAIPEGKRARVSGLIDCRGVDVSSGPYSAGSSGVR